MNKVRWGLLSTARINRSLIPAIRASRHSDLNAVASRSADQARQYAQEWEIPLAFGGYQEMLDSGQVDAVYISLPNHLHAEWTVRALNAGVAVLCEKPFALSLAEVDAMIAASRASGKPLAEAFMYRHHPQTKIAGDLIQRGDLGEISHAWGTFSFLLDRPEDVRLQPEMGGGCLWDIGIYPLSLAQFVFGGAPLSVYGTQVTGASGVDMTFAGQMRYSGDRFAQISASFRTDYHAEFQVMGTLGRLHFNRPFTALKENRKLMFHPNKGDPRELRVPEQELYYGEVEDLNHALLENAPTYLRLEESRQHVQTALALYESARSGQPAALGGG